MNWVDAQTVVFDTAAGPVRFAVNWWLQSTLLIAAGLAIGWLLRHRGSANQSVVYRTTLVAVLLCPIATWSLSAAGVPGWSVQLPAGWSYLKTDVADRVVGAPLSVAPLRHEQAKSAPTIIPAQTFFDGPATSADGHRPFAPAPVAEDTFQGPELRSRAGVSPVEPAGAEGLGETEGVSIHRFGWAAIGLTASWLLVSALLGTRLVVAWRRLSRLRDASSRANSDVMGQCRELAASLGVSAPDVRCSPYLPSPCLVGLRNPAVMLPEGQLVVSLRDTLVHELAHLRRRDCHWNLLRRVSTVLFFYQPLMWILSRRIEVAAEEVCDDYVVRYGGDREAYAHRLVDIAELSSTPIAAAGVGVVSLRSMLARRVTRILDTSRPLSTRVGNLLLAAVLAGAAIGTATVGLLGLGPRPSQAETDLHAVESETTVRGQAEGGEADREGPAEDDAITIRGKVVDPDGNPMARATVHVIRWYWDPDLPKLPLATATSDVDGRFEVTYRKSQFTVDVQRPEMWNEVTIIASAAEFGPAWVRRQDLRRGQPPTLRLVRDDIPITGRVVDLEGNPLSGVEVRIDRLFGADDGTLDAWIDALGRGEIIWEATNRHLRSTPHVPEGIVEVVRTKTDGSFAVRGVGRDRRVDVTLQGPTIAYTQATILTRRMKPVVASDGMPHPEWSSKSTVYGADFQIVVQPTQPITGTVRDADTGDPLPGVAVESYRMTARGISGQRQVRVQSDDQGRFRLVGMPKGPGKRIIAVPNDDQPYLMREFDVPDQPGLAPIEMDLELHRGVWITGRVTDKATARPVPVRVHYLPYRTNPFAQALPEFDEHGNVDGYQTRYRSNEDGFYRVVGLPGRAIVGVECVTKPYPRGMGHDKIGGLEEGRHFPTYRNPVGPGPRWPTAMKELSIAEGADAVPLDFELESGRSITITAIGPDGGEVTGMDVVGFQNRWSMKSVDSATFDAVAFAPGETRMMLLHHPEQRIGKALLVSADDGAPRKRTVQLQPCAVIRGRLVDDNQQPIAGARIRISPRPGGDFSPELESIATGADGAFEHQGVLPGANYDVMSESTQVGFKTLAEDLPVEPGETVDLGTIDVTGDGRPDPVRTKGGLTQASDAAGSPQPPTTGGETAASANQAAQDDNLLRYEGKVVDPDGKPVGGATIFFAYWVPDASPDYQTKPRAVTNAKGEFQFSAKEADFADGEENAWQTAGIVATADGYGFAFGLSTAFETTGQAAKSLSLKTLAYFKERLKNPERVLRLVRDDTPISARVVDSDGQPVAGARIRVDRLWWSENGSLDGWEEGAKKEKADFYSLRSHTTMSMNGPQVAAIVPEVTTNASGEFTLRGIGRERVAQLLIAGPAIETSMVKARTRIGEKVVVPHQWGSRVGPKPRDETYYGAHFTHVAGPSRPVVGRVRDIETNQPILGAVVRAGQSGTFFRSGQPYIAAITDAQGRYRLEGLAVDQPQSLNVFPPHSTAYLPVGAALRTSLDQPETTRDFRLKRGVWVRGRAIDDRTGKPVAGRVQYYAADANPHLDSYEGFARGFLYHERRTDSDGRFEIPVVPGPGIITFMALNHTQYRRGFGAETITVTADGGPNGPKMFRTRPTRVISSNEHVLRQIEPTPGSPPIDVQLNLTSGVNVVGQLVGPDGRPVSGGIISGSVFAGAWYPIVGETFTVEGYYPDRPRELYFYHPDLDRGAHYHLEGPAPNELIVKLQATGAVRGRLVDDDGGPRAGFVLRGDGVPNENYGNADMRLGTGDDGRFVIRGLLPGRKYTVSASSDRQFGTLLKDITVEAGKVKDVGDVTLLAPVRGAALSAPAAVRVGSVTPEAEKSSDTSAETGPMKSNTIHGQITGPDGKPAAGAHVAVVAMLTQTGRGGDLSPRGEVLAEGVTDAGGGFRLVLEGVSSRTHQYANLIARKDGTVVAWKQLNLDAESVEIVLELQPDEPITARLVDIEGQPAEGVRLMVQAVVKRSIIGKLLDRGVGYRGGDRVPAAWLQPVTSDVQGRFAVAGVPAGCGVFLNVVGNDRFAPQDIALNTGMPEQRGERDATYRALVKNAQAGEEAVLPLAPAQRFEGVVTFEDTGKPAPHARLTIWASQQQYGSMSSVAGHADAEGKYRISPHPGIRFGVTAYPPDGTPYLARHTPLSRAIHWNPGDRVRNVDLSLPRGVLVRGKVVEEGTGTPVAGATVQYVPERANNPNTAEDILTGWQGIQLSDEQGRFSIAVLPGPGRLLVHGPNGRYILREIPSRQLSDGKSGGQRNYVHAAYPLSPEPDAGPIDVTISLTPGATVSGRIVDDRGTPVDEAVMVTRLVVYPTSLQWRGHMPTTLGGRFELSGLDEGKGYPVHFLDARRRLGATVTIQAGDKDPTVVLKPCGQATARFFDPQGMPQVGFTPGFYMIVTPGADRYDFEAARRGELLADSDFVANIDRTNYWPAPKTDSEGRVAFPALIPGATYRLSTFTDGKPMLIEQFTVESGEEIDLGEFRLDRED